MGSNPGTVFWMGVSDASYYTTTYMKINKNKGSRMGHTKKIFKKKEIGKTNYFLDFDIDYNNWMILLA